MKLKLSFLAGALALAVAGQASAVINGVSPTGNGGLILSIWDTTTNTSYTKDLGLVMNSFVSGAVVNGGSSFVAGDAGNAGLSASWAADATLTSFLAGATAATTQWNVTATDMVGITGAAGNAYNAARVLTTTQVVPTGLVNGQVKGMNVDAYYNQASILSGANTSVATTAAAGVAGYAGVTTFGNNFGGKINFSNAAGLGQSQNFYFLTNNPTAAGFTAASTPALIGQFANTTGASTWTLASNGALNYTVAAVPEPGEWALMLSGFGLIGFIATRRRNMNTGMMNIA